MESPVVLDKPPEYHNERGFPFDEEEGSGAWSELASRHPDIAARLRQRPATWARKRRPSSQDGVDDTADSFGGFDRFPFDDIPQEFREHFPSHWNRRFGSREEQFQPEPTSPQPQSPSQQTTATQTEQEAGPSREEPIPLPQYGLRNTVDLGQKSAADPSVVDAEDRNQRSMSAPPDHRTVNQSSPKMSGQNHQEHQSPQSEQSSNVRHIPIFVEGRDEPVINKSVDHGTHFADQKPSYVPPPQPHIDRENYFADDGPVGFPFAKSFDRPFFRQSAQPFSKQKMYPQSAFARGASPQRSQSPKPQNYQEQTSPRAETPSRQQPQQKQPPPQQKPVPPQQKQAPPQQKQAPPQQRATSPQAAQNRNQTPPPHVPSANDPITQILSIQTDVLNLMTEVENFKGAKNDKQYLFLDEMLTRNLIKLDNIETEGKENIRQARREAIRCIQKCIAVLEAKAESNSADAKSATAAQDIEMHNPEHGKTLDEQPNVQNGDIDMKETTKEQTVVESNLDTEKQNSVPQSKVPIAEEKPEDAKQESVQGENKLETAEQSQIADTRPEETKGQEPTQDTKSEPVAPETNIKNSPKKTAKKRDKSKENKKEEVSEKKEVAVDSVKDEKKVQEVEEQSENKKKESHENEVNSEDNKVKVEVMQIDAKGDSEKANSQGMEVDGAASQ